MKTILALILLILVVLMGGCSSYSNYSGTGRIDYVYDNPLTDVRIKAVWYTDWREFNRVWVETCLKGYPEGGIKAIDECRSIPPYGWAEQGIRDGDVCTIHMMKPTEKNFDQVIHTTAHEIIAHCFWTIHHKTKSEL